VHAGHRRRRTVEAQRVHRAEAFAKTERTANWVSMDMTGYFAAETVVMLA
jgi:hypothetical protein